MQQLVKRMLRVVTCLAPDHHPGCTLHRFAVHAHRFTARLHLHLLQIRGEPIQPVIVRKNCLCLCAKEIVVPDANQCEQHRHVLTHRGLLKMLVHNPRTGQHPAEGIHARHQRKRQANRRPDRKAPAYPVPESKAKFRVDAETVHSFVIG